MLVRSTRWSWLNARAMMIAKRRGMTRAIVALAGGLVVMMHRISVDVTAACPFCARSGLTHSNTKACHSIKNVSAAGQLRRDFRAGAFAVIRLIVAVSV
jgi:hypothetical protein